MNKIKNYYDQYKEYLREDNVRQAHNNIFAYFERFIDTCFPYVVDLGCGTQEFYEYGCFRGEYFGIDKDYIEDNSNAVIGDYLEKKISDYCPFQPDAFISLFSSELYLPAHERYDFYERIFRENPTIEVGLTAGCYYKGYEDSAYYIENNNSIIHQTIEDQKYFRRNLFDEWRTHIDVPSKMFGQDVVEVWKIFLRKG